MPLPALVTGPLIAVMQVLFGLFGRGANFSVPSRGIAEHIGSAQPVGPKCPPDGVIAADGCFRQGNETNDVNVLSYQWNRI